MGPGYKKRRRRRSVLTEVAEEMRGVLRGLGKGNPHIHPEIWARWSLIVGDELARRTIPRAIQGRTLLLAVASSAWMNELTFLRRSIVDKISDAVGPNTVTEVRLVLDAEMTVRPTMPPPAPERPAPHSDAPLPEAVRLAIEQISDATLKETILRAARANIR